MPHVAALGHVTLHAREPQRLAHFYRDLLDMVIVGRTAPWNLAFLCSDPAARPLQDHQLAFSSSPEMAHVAFYVDDLGAIRSFHRALRERGVPAKALLYGIGVSLIFRDPEENGVEITWLHDHDSLVPYAEPLDLARHTDQDILAKIAALPPSSGTLR